VKRGALWVLLVALAWLSYQLGRSNQARADDRALWVLDSLNAEAPTVAPPGWLPAPDARRRI
jgi:hypothetical protein